MTSWQAPVIRVDNCTCRYYNWIFYDLYNSSISTIIYYYYFHQSIFLYKKWISIMKSVPFFLSSFQPTHSILSLDYMFISMMFEQYDRIGSTRLPVNVHIEETNLFYLEGFIDCQYLHIEKQYRLSLSRLSNASFLYFYYFL